MSNYSDSSFHENNANTSWYKVFNLIPDKSKVLDVGCSSGNFGLELINRKNCEVDGIEIDSSDYKKAKTKLRNVYQLNIENDSVDNLKDKYDIIYFGDVIEHLVNPVKALKNVKRLLTHNGKVLFSIPNMTHIAVRLLLLKGDFEYTETGLLDKTHLHFYSLDEVYRIFLESGYMVDHIDFVERDYPKSVIKDWLMGIGLEANDKFYTEMSKPEASAFQFVGTAKPAANTKPTKRKQFGPIDLYESYHNSLIKELKARIEFQQSELAQLREVHERLTEQVDMLKKHPAHFIANQVRNKLKRAK